MGSESERNVAVFWDYENCEIPSSSDGYSAAAGIRNLVEKFGPVKLFKATSSPENSQTYPKG
ncbi:hypothetical protein QCA50_002762 [Cerrena zonata]|uniref:NYN domain-containing protein n=1 Tax=Cerrena zonata TaxID=2478898 RepID=A0AAW0GUQ3_9APHY